MSAAYLFAAVLGVSATAFAARSAFFALPSSVQLPDRMVRALRHAPVCALTAIVAPAVFTDHGKVLVSLGNHRIWAVAAAAAIFAWKRSMLLMMAVGMAVFTALRLVG